MRFFHLTHPEYASDFAYARRNPVTVTNSHRIPGMICPVCGPWTSMSWLRVPLPRRRAAFAGMPFLRPTEWHEARPSWARLLGIAPDAIEPGAAVGPPTGECRTTIREDVVHPMPGPIWVTPPVRDAITKAKLTGVTMMKVRLTPARYARPLFELVVTGRAWRRGWSPTTVRRCKRCGRPTQGHPPRFDIDERQWDGSDFMHADGNPNRVIVTERVAALLDQHRFTNIIATPLVSRGTRRGKPSTSKGRRAP